MDNGRYKYRAGGIQQQQGNVLDREKLRMGTWELGTGRGAEVMLEGESAAGQAITA